MSFRNKEIQTGDLVETIWTDSKGVPVLFGIVLGVPKEWEGRKVSVLWCETGARLEWINDIRRVKTE